MKGGEGSEGGRRGAKGAKGSEGWRRGAKGAKGSEGSEGERRGAKGSEAYSILGFRVPTTCEYKKFDYHV